MKKTYQPGTLQAHFQPRSQLRDYHKSDVQRRNERMVKEVNRFLKSSHINLKFHVLPDPPHNYIIRKIQEESRWTREEAIEWYTLFYKTIAYESTLGKYLEDFRHEIERGLRKMKERQKELLSKI